MSPWSNFFVVIGVQVLFLLFLAHQKRVLKQITPVVILKNVAAALVIGIPLELLIGKYLGIFSHPLHFQPLFLVMYTALSYGLWLLTLRLLKSEYFLSFLAWNIILGIVYEVANYFFPVWSWHFSGNFWYQEGILILLGCYYVPALLVALAASFATRVKFNAFKLKTGRG